MNKIRIAITGGRGRMGQITILDVMDNDGTVLTGVLVRPNSPDVGQPVNIPDTGLGTGFHYSDSAQNIFKTAEAIIDFSIPEASLSYALMAAKTGTPLVIGTTGFSERQLKEIEAAAKDAPILLSYNMSFGITALANALDGLSKALGSAFHLEITDIHHTGKKDAPSGTALMLGEATGRQTKDIKYTSYRKGNIIGEHRILFSGPAEQIEIIHKAKDRRLFAQGAVLAAKWLIGQKPGLYNLQDIFD